MSLSNTADLGEVIAAVSERYPMIANGLIDIDDPLVSRAEDALAYLSHLPSSVEGLDHAVDAFAQTSIEFLRLQARFVKTGTYARSTAVGLHDELYGDPEEMDGYYLDGLAMTYALWPNHARLLDFLVQGFVPALPSRGTLLEIGPGHGLLGHTVLTAQPEMAYTALDISASALAYVNRAFQAMSHAPPDLIEGDATDQSDPAIPSGVDAIICCEVLEHVDDPVSILVSIRERLGDGGRAFISTVANLEAIDHVYLFDDPDHIRSAIAEAGLEIIEDQAMRLPGDKSTQLIPYNYAAVVESSHDR